CSVVLFLLSRGPKKEKKESDDPRRTPKGPPHPPAPAGALAFSQPPTKAPMPAAREPENGQGSSLSTQAGLVYSSDVQSGKGVKRISDKSWPAGPPPSCCGWKAG